MFELIQSWFPPLLIDFVLTLASALLIGLGLHEYYLATQKEQVFGSTRTCTFLGLAGFVLFRLDAAHHTYLAGFVLISLFLGQFYRVRASQGHFGLISIMVAVLCYLLGPITQIFPKWFLVLFAMSVLLILNAKPRIAWITRTITNDDLLNLAKFLLLAGVILPLAPDSGISDLIPVSAHQTWLAVVVISGISFLGYLLQTYAFPGKGLLLTGAIGGLYSSTATTVAIARQLRSDPDSDGIASAAIVLASMIMFLRLLVIAGIFNMSLCLMLMPYFLALALAMGVLAYLLGRQHAGVSVVDSKPLKPRENPLELGSALVFAALFVFISALTHWVLNKYSHSGLLWLAGLVGFTDIDPFVLSLVQGSYSAPSETLAKALLVAASSNNLLKAVYVWFWGAAAVARRAGSVLLLVSLIGFGLASL